MKFPKGLKFEACAAREPGRYAMHGFHVERDTTADTEEPGPSNTLVNGAPGTPGEPVRTLGARVTTTDGRRLVVVPATLEAGDDVHGQIVPLAAIALARKVAGARVDPSVAVNGSAVAGGQTFAPIAGEFPKYRDVIPDVSRDFVAVTLNAAYVAEVLAAISREDAEGGRPVTFYFHKTDRHAPAVLSTVAHGVGVVMPIGGRGVSDAEDRAFEAANLARVAWARGDLQREQDEAAHVAACAEREAARVVARAERRRARGVAVDAEAAADLAAIAERAAELATDTTTVAPAAERAA